MRIIVTGGRHFTDREFLYRCLDSYDGVSEIIHGGASGADRLAGDWASDNNVPSIVFKAQWDIHGRAAGPIRNKLMAQYGADLCLAFEGGRGTANMVKTAKDFLIPVQLAG